MVRPKRFDAKGVVPRDRPRSVGLSLLCALAGRYDGRSAPRGDGVMALAGVEGTISGDGADLLISWDLVEQFGQHRGVKEKV